MDGTPYPPLQMVTIPMAVGGSLLAGWVPAEEAPWSSRLRSVAASRGMSALDATLYTYSTLALDPKTQAFGAVIEFTNPQMILKFGITVDVFIETYNKSNAIVVDLKDVQKENDQYSVFVIENDKAQLKPADHLWGKTTHETTDVLVAETHKNAKVACIGPAGERLVSYATRLNNGSVFKRLGFLMERLASP